MLHTQISRPLMTPVKTLTVYLQYVCVWNWNMDSEIFQYHHDQYETSTHCQAVHMQLSVRINTPWKRHYECECVWPRQVMIERVKNATRVRDSAGALTFCKCGWPVGWRLPPTPWETFPTVGLHYVTDDRDQTFTGKSFDQLIISLEESPLTWDSWLILLVTEWRLYWMC